MFVYICIKIYNYQAGISATPHEDNLRYFDVIITGPDSSPYQGTLIIRTK